MYLLRWETTTNDDDEDHDEDHDGFASNVESDCGGRLWLWGVWVVGGRRTVVLLFDRQCEVGRDFDVNGYQRAISSSFNYARSLLRCGVLRFDIGSHVDSEPGILGSLNCVGFPVNDCMLFRRFLRHCFITGLEIDIRFVSLVGSVSGACLYHFPSETVLPVRSNADLHHVDR